LKDFNVHWQSMNIAGCLSLALIDNDLLDKGVN